MNSIRLLIIVVILNAKVENFTKRVIKVKIKKSVNSNHIIVEKVFAIFYNNKFII